MVYPATNPLLRSIVVLPAPFPEGRVHVAAIISGSAAQEKRVVAVLGDLVIQPADVPVACQRWGGKAIAGVVHDVARGVVVRQRISLK